MMDAPARGRRPPPAELPGKDIQTIKWTWHSSRSLPHATRQLALSGQGAHHLDSQRKKMLISNDLEADEKIKVYGTEGPAN